MDPINDQSREAAGVAERLTRELGLDGTLERFPTGSRPVFATSTGYAIKLFPTSEQADWRTEVAALGKLQGALSLATPRLEASGQRDGWHFVLMNRLPGRLMSEVWSTFDTDTRRRFARQVGAVVAELHALATSDVSELELDWSGFCTQQRESCRARQAAKQLGSPWLEQVDAFLERWQPQDDGRRALLHTELMREHLLVERDGAGWRLSGLFDFEPAMVGAPEYDFAAAGVFVTGAEPGLFATLLEGYGATTDDERPYRVMAYALLHRYSNLRWYLERLPPGPVTDLEALARQWFG